MKSILDDATVDITCPHCGRKMKQRLGKLKTNPLIKCLGCGNDIQIDAKGMGRSLQKVDDAAAKLRRAVGRLGK